MVSPLVVGGERKKHNYVYKKVNFSFKVTEGCFVWELPHGDDCAHLPGGQALGREQEHPRLRRQSKEHFKQGRGLIKRGGSNTERGTKIKEIIKGGGAGSPSITPTAQKHKKIKVFF